MNVLANIIKINGKDIKDARATQDITDLKSQMEELPSERNSEKSGVDLDVSDPDGYVVMRLKDGHIQTSGFNSEDVPQARTIPKLSASNGIGNLDIADSNGYVAMRLKDGHIITPEFNSANAATDEKINESISEMFDGLYDGRNRLKNIKWDTLGDSITAAATIGLSQKNYTRWISEANGISLNNVAVGGKGWWEGIEDEVSNVREDTDIVTILGSLNDITSYITNPGTPGDKWSDGRYGYCARVARVFDAIYAVRYDIRIGVILPPPWYNYNPYDTAAATQEDVENMLESLAGCCRVYGIPVLDMYHCSNMRPWDADFRLKYYVATEYDGSGHPTATDGVHPNQLGHKLFVAPQIENFLRSLAITY